MSDIIEKKEIEILKEIDEPTLDNIDYKDVELLKKFTSERGKILPRRLTGANAKQQRNLAQAVKRARFLALIAPIIN